MKVQKSSARCDLGEDGPNAASHQPPDSPGRGKGRLNQRGSSTDKRSWDTSQERGSGEATGDRGGQGWTGDTAALEQSISKPSVLKRTEGEGSVYREGRVYHLPKVRLMTNLADHGPACLCQEESLFLRVCLRDWAPLSRELLVLRSAFDREISPVLFKSQPGLSTS